MRFQVGLRHAALPASFSVFSLAARLELAVTGPTRRSLLVQEPHEVPEMPCPPRKLCDVDTVGDDVDQREKELGKLSFTRTVQQLKYLCPVDVLNAVAGQPLLPCRERAVAEQLPGSSSHRPSSLASCRIFCRLSPLVSIFSLHGVLWRATKF